MTVRTDDLRVLIDVTAVPPSRGGVGRYVDDLVLALCEHGGVRVALACQARDVETYGEMVPSAKLFPLGRWAEPQPARLAWEQTGLPTLVARLRPDVVHSPHYTQPFASDILAPHSARVVTVHDATFFSAPEVHSQLKQRFFRTMTRLAACRADAVIVPSAATRDEIVRLAGADPNRCHVAYHGVDQRRFHPVDDVERRRVMARLGVGDEGYVAFLGTLEPRKNVSALIQGWVHAVQEMEHPPALLLAGAPGWDESIDGTIACVPAHLSVRRLGYLPLEDLAGFLAAATLVAYPSLGEGFGLPVLEAMACGASVLTTRRLSLPEVGGDAVAYCDVGATSIGRAIADLLTDGDRRAALGRAALERSTAFTWAASADAHMNAYRAAIDRHKNQREKRGRR